MTPNINIDHHSLSDTIFEINNVNGALRDTNASRRSIFSETDFCDE